MSTATSTPRRTRRLPALVALVALLVAGCSGASAGMPAGSGSGAGYVQGDGRTTVVAAPDRAPAPALSGSTLEGKPYSLADQRGKVVVLNVWAAWCPPCRAELPGLQRVHRSMRARGVTFVGLNEDDDVHAATALQERIRLSYPSVHDDGGALLLGFRSTLPPGALPSTLVIDRQGRIAVRVLGQVSEDHLRDLLRPLVEEKA